MLNDFNRIRKPRKLADLVRIVRDRLYRLLSFLPIGTGEEAADLYSTCVSLISRAMARHIKRESSTSREGDSEC